MDAETIGIDSIALSVPNMVTVITSAGKIACQIAGNCNQIL